MRGIRWIQRLFWQRIKDEAIRYIIGSIALFVVGALCYFLTGDAVWIEELKKTYVGNLVFDIFDPLFSRPGSYLQKHPLRFIGSVVIIIISSVSFLYARKYRKALNDLQKKNNKNEKTMHQFGITEFWPNANKSDREEQWKNLSDRILAQPQSSLNIVGATGWETFGAHGPLKNILSGFDKQIRILLLDPNSSCLEKRAESLGITKEKYKKNLNKILNEVQVLHRKGRNIEVRFYDHLPSWKMIMTPNTLWLQYYKIETHVAETPVYTLYATQEGQALYSAFSYDFDRMWRYGTIREINKKSGRRAA